MDSKNIICVDWSKLSGLDIPLPISFAMYLKILQRNDSIAGKRIADLISFLVRNKVIAGPELVHIIGQSLGTLVAKAAGVSVKKLTGKKVVRITVIDPAGK
jgi:hypothetical protein